MVFWLIPSSSFHMKLLTFHLKSCNKKFTHMETSPCRWRAAYFDLCLTLMDIEQWGFLSVSHLLWHEASVYNGHLLEPVALTPIAEHLTVELSLPVFTTYVCRGWDSYNQPSTCEENALTDCATAAVNVRMEELFSPWQHYTTSPVHFFKSVVQ